MRELKFNKKARGKEREKGRGKDKGEKVEMSRVVVPVLEHEVRHNNEKEGRTRRPPPPVLPKKGEQKSKTKPQHQTRPQAPKV